MTNLTGYKSSISNVNIASLHLCITVNYIYSLFWYASQHLCSLFAPTSIDFSLGQLVIKYCIKFMPNRSWLTPLCKLPYVVYKTNDLKTALFSCRTGCLGRPDEQSSITADFLLLPLLWGVICPDDLVCLLEYFTSVSCPDTFLLSLMISFGSSKMTFRIFRFSTSIMGPRSCEDEGKFTD